MREKLTYTMGFCLSHLFHTGETINSRATDCPAFSLRKYIVDLNRLFGIAKKNDEVY